MTNAEWESLCDGCGRCCLNKFEDDGGQVFFTDVACKLFNTKTCACTDYPNRKKKVPDCILLTPKIMPKMTCLPKTCAYRLLEEGKDLPWWHHLRSGSRKTVHDVGISVKNRAISEVGLTDEEIESRIVTWPTRAGVRKPKT